MTEANFCILNSVKVICMTTSKENRVNAEVNKVCSIDFFTEEIWHELKGLSAAGNNSTEHILNSCILHANTNNRG